MDVICFSVYPFGAKTCDDIAKLTFIIFKLNENTQICSSLFITSLQHKTIFSQTRIRHNIFTEREKQRNKKKVTQLPSDLRTELTKLFLWLKNSLAEAYFNLGNCYLGYNVGLQKAYIKNSCFQLTSLQFYVRIFSVSLRICFM